MISPKMIGVVVGALILGGVVGRMTSPRDTQKMSKVSSISRDDAPLSTRVSETREGSSRAIADVTPGRENEKQERIPSLREIVDGSFSRKVWLNVMRFTSSLDRGGVLAALQQLEGLPVAKRELLFQGLITRLAELDPKEAIRYVSAMKDSQNGEMNYHNIAATWADSDFSAAKAWAFALPEGNVRRNAIAGVINALAAKDPDAALKLVLSMPKMANNGYSWAYSVFGTLASRNPADAARRAVSLPGNEFRQQAISSVAGVWAGTDPKAAAVWAATLSGNLQQQALSNIIQTWSRTDPNAAAEYVSKLPPGRVQNEVVGNLASQWARQDSKAALAWAEKLPLGSGRDNALQNTLSQWAQTDPKNAAEYVMKMAGENKFDRYLQSLTYSWGRNDPAAALAWAKAQNNPAVDKSFTAGLLGQWAQYEPQKAVAEIAAIKSPDAQKQAIEQISSQWSRSEPEKAITWLTQLPEGDSRDNALRNAVSNWSRDNPENTSAWLNQLPTGKTRDSMISTFANNISEFDPVSAATWATSVGDEKQRGSAVRNVLSNWSRNDKASAQQWLARQTTLSKPEFESYQQQINSAR